MTAGEWLDHMGIKASTLVAGLVGGLLSLSMMPALTFRRMVSAVLGGAASAAYLTPIAAEYVGLQSRHVENGMAFVLGIVGMNIIGGVFTLSDRWRKRPTLDLDEIKAGLPEDDKK